MSNYGKILRYLTLLIGILVRGDVDFVLHFRCQWEVVRQAAAQNVVVTAALYIVLPAVFCLVALQDTAFMQDFAGFLHTPPLAGLGVTATVFDKLSFGDVVVKVLFSVLFHFVAPDLDNRSCIIPGVAMSISL